MLSRSSIFFMNYHSKANILKLLIMLILASAARAGFSGSHAPAWEPDERELVCMLIEVSPF
jgi:hypothetical protein